MLNVIVDTYLNIEKKVLSPLSGERTAGRFRCRQWYYSIPFNRFFDFFSLQSDS